jgi:hypothetical protein
VFFSSAAGTGDTTGVTGAVGGGVVAAPVVDADQDMTPEYHQGIRPVASFRGSSGDVWLDHWEKFVRIFKAFTQDLEVLYDLIKKGKKANSNEKDAREIYGDFCFDVLMPFLTDFFAGDWTLRPPAHLQGTIDLQVLIRECMHIADWAQQLGSMKAVYEKEPWREACIDLLGKLMLRKVDSNYYLLKGTVKTNAQKVLDTLKQYDEDEDGDGPDIGDVDEEVLQNQRQKALIKDYALPVFLNQFHLILKGKQTKEVRQIRHGVAKGLSSGIGMRKCVRALNEDDAELDPMQLRMVDVLLGKVQGYADFKDDREGLLLDLRDKVRGQMLKLQQRQKTIRHRATSGARGAETNKRASLRNLLGSGRASVVHNRRSLLGHKSGSMRKRGTSRTRLESDATGVEMTGMGMTANAMHQGWNNLGNLGMDMVTGRGMNLSGVGSSSNFVASRLEDFWVWSRCGGRYIEKLFDHLGGFVDDRFTDCTSRIITSLNGYIVECFFTRHCLFCCLQATCFTCKHFIFCSLMMWSGSEPIALLIGYCKRHRTKSVG